MVIDWLKPEYCNLPGLRMAFWQIGEKSPNRPSIVLCHGFPEIAYSWRHLGPHLAQAGFHVIIPDQRGYGFTGPALDDAGDENGVLLYDMDHLCGDLISLLDTLDVATAVFCGHDWGGLIVWQMPLLHPSRVAGVIGVNTPFIPRLQVDPIEAFRAVLGEDMYIVAFQDFGRAEALIERDIARSLRCFYRRSDGKTLASGPWENFALFKILDMAESDWPGSALLNSETFEHYVQAFERSGFRGPINWYRNFSRNWRASASLPQTVSLPSLMIAADSDPFFPPSSVEPMQKYVTDLETHFIKNCGHWTQAEQPEELARIATDWLTRRFV